MSFLSGFVAIAGPPNVGKSTLLNRILGRKISIVSPKPQTTRNRITAVLNGEDFQLVFIDTPGIHKTKTALHRSMVESAMAALQEVDLVLLLIDAGRPNDPEIPPIIRRLHASRKPAILVINKMDLGPPERALPVIEEFRSAYPFEAFLPVSALRGDGVQALLGQIKAHLVPGPQFFPPDISTDQTEAFFIAEIIREKIFLRTRGDIPYACAVTVDRIEERERGDLLEIDARIHVETENQKGILIGRQGKMIQSIGRAARLELEKRFGIRVFLSLSVRVEKNWNKDTRALRRLGY